MSKPFPTDNPFLLGNYAPWPLEGDLHDAVIEGEVPRELCGTLWRNGPNPQFAPRGAYHWFDGDGMVHAFRFRDGRVSYRNRWVRTARFQRERAAGESLFGGLENMAGSDPRLLANPVQNASANTNIVWHAGRLLALVENSAPHLLDPRTLETQGLYDFDGRLIGPMTAHPKLDPETGEMLFFGYSPLPPYLRYHAVDASGRVTRSVEIEVHAPTMMHDFITTRNHVIFMVLPAVFQLDKVAEGGSALAWRPEVGARVGVMPRAGGSADVRWFDIEPCYVFHPLNAYEDGDRIVADVCRYQRLPLFENGDEVDGMQDLSAKLTRWTMDLAGGSLKEERLDDAPSEFPRLDERFAGLAYRHGYAAGILRKGDEKVAGMNAILHYDLKSGRRAQHLLPSSDAAGEPIFVPRKADSPEGDGFLLSVVYRGEEKRSDVLVLDAKNVGGAPLATVKLPHRVPFGFHGNWGQDV